MADVLTTFQALIAAPDGRLFSARACGMKAADGLWHGWVEFTPGDGGSSIASARETTQPNRVDTEYWASGLTTVYLEGALQRALDGPPTVTARQSPGVLDDRPATRRAATPGRRESPLDPFSVYEKGEQLLRKQLGALSSWHLVNIVLAYELSDESAEALTQRSAEYLIEVIVRRVRVQRRVRNE